MRFTIMHRDGAGNLWRRVVWGQARVAEVIEGLLLDGHVLVSVTPN